MNAAMLVLEALGIVAMVLIHRRQLKGLSSFFTDRLVKQDEAEEGRRVAAYKMSKANERRVANSDAAVRRMVDATRSLQDDARQALQKVDRHVSDQKQGNQG